ncbi:hypothetical protein ERJ75_000132400 [Trypanosoma vivax]|uniref:EF-hand domain-containing protein n=1 Tax=Trypanosoma vivax (strain Y486) TaxID=1055687 RepID=G0TT47_TRYVY|nr:hypothetical protein TRVL_07651 [Trypanosoma vivax]KAH8619679.1 hypothetical protein ERJ75_000132400 [Trypanosoma vivax]CCC47128.1 conserved hypothetical protein [Trypanosoma vivax Y486]
METELVPSGNSRNAEVMELLATNCSRPQSSACEPSSSKSAVNRLTLYAEPQDPSPSKRNSRREALTVLPTRLSFDLIGVRSLTEDMLRELYSAFDVRQCGGVERNVMREIMSTGFSHYGAPCSEKDIDRLFENATPFHIRRHLKDENVDTEIMSFNEFCVLFLSWLRL